MKNILVPTDFSACATNATKAAFDLADLYGAKIHLYTRLKIHEKWSELSEGEKQDYPETLQKIHNTEVLFAEWKEAALLRNLDLHTTWSSGSLIENIDQYIDEHKIDFVVMGSHGASGKDEFIMGSNTQKVVRKINTPVLIVKDDLKKCRLDKVIFASNFDEVEKKPFQYLLDFLAPFDTEIHLVEINTSSWFGQPYVLSKAAMEDFKAMCTNKKCFTHFVRDWNIDLGIRNFGKKINADMIAISNQQRHPIKRIFVGSNVEALVNHSDLPVLSIDFSDT